MKRNLRHEYALLKKQYHEEKQLTADDYLRGMLEIAEAYFQLLDENGLMLQPLEVPASA